MRRQKIIDTDNGEPVMVPRNDKPLVPVAPERVRRLREHLTQALLELRSEKHPEQRASPARPEPPGFAARVAQTACSLCKGSCCRNGADDAFLDDRTLARVRLAMPDMTDEGMLRLYLDLVPPVSYRDSCIFHGNRGCTLDRSMRSDVCNSYYCGGVLAYLQSGNPPAPTLVIAGEGEKMRTSPLLLP